MMNRVEYSPGPAAERRQLLVLGVGIQFIAACFYWFTGTTMLPMIFIGLGSLALAGGIAHKACGRSVFLLFAVFSSVVGRAVSAAIIAFVYFWAILVFGSILRLFGMNKLERNFYRCRDRETMLVDAPTTDAESFRRQS